MPLNSIHNGRGFFSDYWLGSVLSAKKTKIPKLSTAQAKKTLWWLSKLHDRVDTDEPPALTDFRERFARPLLQDVFGYQLLEDGNEPRLRLLARADDVAAKKQLACVLLAPEAEDADTRQMRDKIGRALLDHDLNYGFVLTPHALRLVRKPGLGNRGAYFEFAIAEAVESDDVDSLDVAVRILRADNFVAADSEPPLIESLEHDSQVHSARVSEDLKQAVFSSAEMLIRGLLEDVQHRPEIAPQGRALTTLRDDALLTLYRLLFVLYAESRDERLQTHSLYWKNYSLDSLVESLLRTHEEAIPSNRFGHWARLQALLRIYDQGLPPVPGLQNIPPRGGRLFSAKTSSGEFLTKVQLPDRLIARLVLTLATTRPRRGVGRERVSYREMQIEQLGSVYEGLLEYEPRTATGTLIEVKVQGRQFVLPPSELVRLCEIKNLALAGLAEIVAETEAAVLHPDNAPEIEETTDDEDDEDENEAEEEDKGVKKGALAKLIRRLESGEFYFVPGSARKSSGSFYTVEEIVQFLVVKALDHLVEGRTAAQILLLRIIDIACGSGHFLVGAARYLGHKLFEAYQRELKGEPPPEFSPDLAAKERHARWETEGEAWCKRCIVEKCLFGVDLNPTAVQLAQVALWIESLAGDRPLSFFEHHIRCGNSLLGTWLDTLHIPPHPDLEPTLDRNQLGLFEHSLKNVIRQALQERQLIDAGLPADIRKDSPQEYEYKADRLQRAETLLRQARLLFDIRNAAAFIPAIWSDWPRLMTTDDFTALAQSRPWWNEFEQVRQRERFFHWELEFPEVFFAENPGFDSALGNPPWDKVLPDRQEFYGRHDIFVRAVAGNELDQRIAELLALKPDLKPQFAQYEKQVKTTIHMLRGGPDFPRSKGRTAAAHEDLSKYFLERSLRIVRSGGAVALLLPSVFYNGDGCVTLRQWLIQEGRIVTVFGFENRQKIFPIDSRYKFACFVCRKEKPGEPSFPAIFMRHDVSELTSATPPGMVTLTAEEIERLSPETFALLEYRSPRDQEIIHKMYRNAVTLGDDGAKSWGVHLVSWRAHEMIYNASEDKDLWTDPNTKKLFAPEEVLGRRIEDPLELVRAMDAAGFAPVYEGKHVEQFLHGIKPIRWWLKRGLAQTKYGKTHTAQALVYRETASNTNERTSIAAILPAGSVGAHTLSGIVLKNVEPEAAAVVLNSLCFDFALRLRTAGTHISFTYLRPMPVPVATATNALPKFDTLCAWQQGIQHITQSQPLWENLWLANKAVAQAYGLTADDFAHIMTTFPVFARKRAAFYAYLQERVAEWRAGS